MDSSVHGVAKSRTRLSDFTYLLTYYDLRDLFGSHSALFRTSLMTVEPRSWTEMVDRAPSKEPMVLAAETRTTGSESALILPHYRLSSSYCRPQGSRLSADFFFFFTLQHGIGFAIH